MSEKLTISSISLSSRNTDSSSIALNDVASHLGARQVLEAHSKLLNLLDELKQIEAPICPKLPARNEKDWLNFFSWIDDQLDNEPGQAKNLVALDRMFDIIETRDDKSSSNIENNDQISSQNCSLSAKIPFKRGEVIFNIPRKCMLTTETALKDDDLGDFIRNDSIASTMRNIALVLHVLNEHCKGDRSPWARYLSIMPNRILPVLSMTKDEWRQLLPSAHIYDALKMIRSISRQYSYFYKQLQSTNLPLRKVITFNYYCWGVSIVCSRQNEIPPSDRQWCPGPVISALIPILDMCNHVHDSNQAIFEDNHSILFAPKDIEIGDEIKINYGTRTSGEFYIHNGFVPEIIGSDMVPINLAMNPQDPQYPSRVKLLKILNMPSFGRFKLVANINKMRHRRDPHLTMFFIVYLLPDDDLESILKNDNPVGLADALYEYVQYTSQQSTQQPATSNCDSLSTDGDNNNHHQPEWTKDRLLQLGKKLSELIEEYSCKRASIGVALINRALESESLEKNLVRLLEHERAIYLSYVKTKASPAKDQ